MIMSREWKIRCDDDVDIMMALVEGVVAFFF